MRKNTLFRVNIHPLQQQIGVIMNYFDLFVMTQQAGIENPSLFPFPFHMHLIFACIGAIFFAYRFYTQKRPFQIIMAVAIPLSLLVWISESRALFYGIGIAEAVLIIAAAVASLIFKTPQENDTEAEETANEANSEAEETEDENSVESSGTNEEEQS